MADEEEVEDEEVRTSVRPPAPRWPRTLLLVQGRGWYLKITQESEWETDTDDEEANGRKLIKPVFMPKVRVTATPFGFVHVTCRQPRLSL